MKRRWKAGHGKTSRGWSRRPRERSHPWRYAPRASTAAVGVLLRAAREASLLVVGSRGLGGFAGLLLRSVAQHCAQHADGPVVVFREGGQ